MSLDQTLCLPCLVCSMIIYTMCVRHVGSHYYCWSLARFTLRTTLLFTTQLDWTVNKLPTGNDSLMLTRFSKIIIQATAQMAADKKAVGLSRVHMYE